MATQWIFRECLPEWLDLNPCTVQHAESLRSLPESVNKFIQCYHLHKIVESARKALNKNADTEIAKMSGYAWRMSIGFVRPKIKESGYDSAWSAAIEMSQAAMCHEKFMNTFHVGYRLIEESACVAALRFSSGGNSSTFTGIGESWTIGKFERSIEAIGKTVGNCQKSMIGLIDRMIKLTEQNH